MKQPLYSGKELGRFFQMPCQDAFGVSIDSRTIEEGDIFFAIQGEKQDGHRFVEQALEKGACHAVIRKNALKAELGGTIAVSDTQKALEGLARFARKRTRAKIIGITGSIGKTTLKEALGHCLSHYGSVHISPASYNNHWGLPLSLARLPSRADFGVFELGMNHKGEIAALSDILAAEIGVITAIAPAHIGNLGSLEGIAKAKAEILQNMPPPSMAVLPSDSEFFPLLSDIAGKHGIEVLPFGKGQIIEQTAENLRVEIGGERLSFVPPAHSNTALAVLSVIHGLGLSLAACAKLIGSIPALAGRGKRHVLSIEGKEIVLIDESFNASPASMISAISAMSSAPARKIAVLGDMVELGERSHDYHLALLEPLQNAGVHKVFACGAYIKALYEALPENMKGSLAPNPKLLAENIFSQLQNHDTIMVKASHSCHFDEIVNRLRQ